MSERRFSQEALRLVVAHRGSSAREAENTIPAFEAAIEDGADVVEFDVRMTADDVAVVMHDPDVSRTTDGSGLVRDLDLIEIKRLRIATADGGETEVPTLDEALSCLTGRAAVDVEIKNIPGEPDFDGSKELAVDRALPGAVAGHPDGPAHDGGCRGPGRARVRERSGARMGAAVHRRGAGRRPGARGRSPRAGDAPGHVDHR